VFLALMGALFYGFGWMQLLADGETGTHIRTGDFILATRTVPVKDLYLFTNPKAQWYAWEWLSSVIFSAAHQVGGLKGVVLFTGSIICLALTILFRHMIWRGVHVHIAALITVIAANALGFHFLARPLIFTTLFTVVALWILDRDWSKPDRVAWVLVPMAALWTNLHGGFLVLIIALGLFAAAALMLRDKLRFLRYSGLAAACSAATLINPYGWQLHVHVWNYLRSDWLVSYIQEFQSPVFRGEGMAKVELLLFAGLICVWELARKRRYHQGLVILFWAHASLTSARHATIYILAAVPPMAVEFSCLWARWSKPQSRRSVAGIVRDLVNGLAPEAARTSMWVPAVLVALTFLTLPNWPTDFPPTFPTALLARNAGLFSGAGHETVRVFNVDAWGGYLAYKFYPNRCAFVDGRSDYFGPKVMDEYLLMRSAGKDWQQVMARYDFQLALIAPDWPLVEALKRSNQWVVRDWDKVAVLLERRQ